MKKLISTSLLLAVFTTLAFSQELPKTSGGTIKEKAPYYKFSVSTTYFTFINFGPTSVSMYEFHFGYKITPKDRVEIKAATWRLFEPMGIPMLDGILAMPLDHDRDHIEAAKRLLGGLPIGITHFLFHPSVDTPELRALAPDWPARVANYNAFMSDELKKFLGGEDIKVIGYRAIRNAMRSN